MEGEGRSVSQRVGVGGQGEGRWGASQWDCQLDANNAKKARH